MNHHGNFCGPEQVFPSRAPLQWLVCSMTALWISQLPSAAWDPTSRTTLANGMVSVTPGSRHPQALCEDTQSSESHCKTAFFRVAQRMPSWRRLKRIISGLRSHRDDEMLSRSLYSETMLSSPHILLNLRCWNPSGPKLRGQLSLIASQGFKVPACSNASRTFAAPPRPWKACRCCRTMASKSALARQPLNGPSGASAAPQRQTRHARSLSPPRLNRSKAFASPFSEAILQATGGAATPWRSNTNSAVMSGWGFQPVAPPALLPLSSWPTVGPSASSAPVPESFSENLNR